MSSQSPSSPSPSPSRGSSPSSIQEHWLFLGNPGTGKSTLINCLLGEPYFKGGVSFGRGMTSFLQRVQRDNIELMDTPGLADTALRVDAAKAITEALRGDGVYKIFFVVTLQMGRGKPDDVATITQVLDSVDVPNVKFSIIVNQVKKKQYLRIQEFGDDYRNAVGSICSGKYTTGSVIFVPEMEELDEEENAVTFVPPELKRFLHCEAPTLTIPRSKVREIDVDSDRFNAEVERLQRLVREMELDKQMRDTQWRAFEDQNREQLMESQRMQMEMISKILQQQAQHQAEAQHMQAEAQRRHEESQRTQMELISRIARQPPQCCIS